MARAVPKPNTDGCGGREKTDAKSRAKDRMSAVKETAQQKKDEFVSKATQATPESASAGARQVASTVQSQPLPFTAGGALLFGLIWGVIDDQEPRGPEYRDIRLGKLALALVIEGALFSLVKGFVDHGARHAFTRLTGSWPGDEEPETE